MSGVTHVYAKDFNGLLPGMSKGEADKQPNTTTGEEISTKENVDHPLPIWDADQSSHYSGQPPNLNLNNRAA